MESAGARSAEEAGRGRGSEACRERERFSSRPEAESAFDDSIFSFAETIRDFHNEIAQINQSKAPIMIAGEDGTGKETIVYFNVERKRLPF